jgi:NADH:quinone reductase (non-electrogenic)
MKNIVILGAGYAGMMAALRLSHTTRRSNNVKVTLVNATDTFVERIRLHEVAVGQPPKSHKISHLLRDTNVQFVQAWVSAIYPDTKLVELKTSSGKQTLSYDKLVYALGSTVSRDTVAGVREHAFTLDPNSAPLLQERLNIANQAVIIGGGLTGIEASTEIAEAYPNLKVTLLTSAKLGQNLSEAGQGYLHKAFAEMGIEVRENTRVDAVEAKRILLEDGSSLQSDATLWAAGFKVSELAQKVGFAVNTAGQILVDSELRSISHSDVYAAGDVVAFYKDTALPMRMSCNIAMPLGTHVAENLTAWLKNGEQKPFQFGYIAQCISLGKNRSLVQMVHPDDSTKEQVFTGFLASFVKKGILNYTMKMIELERSVSGVYIYPKNINIAETETSQQAVAEH